MDVKQTDVFLFLFTWRLNNINMHSCYHTNNCFVIENDSFSAKYCAMEIFTNICETSMTGKYFVLV